MCYRFHLSTHITRRAYGRPMRNTIAGMPECLHGGLKRGKFDVPECLYGGLTKGKFDVLLKFTHDNSEWAHYTASCRS